MDASGDAEYLVAEEPDASQFDSRSDPLAVMPRPRCGHANAALACQPAAIARADLHVRWAITATGEEARRTERAVLDALAQTELWNRAR